MISVQCINKVILLQLHFETSIRCFIFFFNSICVMSICLFSQKFFIFDYPGNEIQKYYIRSHQLFINWELMCPNAISCGMSNLKAKKMMFALIVAWRKFRSYFQAHTIDGNIHEIPTSIRCKNRDKIYAKKKKKNYTQDSIYVIRQFTYVHGVVGISLFSRKNIECGSTVFSLKTTWNSNLQNKNFLYPSHKIHNGLQKRAKNYLGLSAQAFAPWTKP